MEKNIIYKPLYSVGKIIESKKTINCAFCEKEIKSQEVVIKEEQLECFYHAPCYKNWQEILTGKIFEISCSW